MDLPMKLLLTSAVVHLVSRLPDRELLNLLPESLADTVVWTKIFSFVAGIGLIFYMIWA